MNRVIEINNRDEDNQLLTTFSIQDKCIELEAIVADKGYNIFKGASVLVAVPTLDESNRYIRKEDCQLFKQQCKEALEMTFYLIENNVDFIAVIKDIDTEIDECLNRLDGRKLDYLICLHEFIDVEKNFIVKSLREKLDSDFVVIELHWLSGDPKR